VPAGKVCPIVQLEEARIEHNRLINSEDHVRRLEHGRLDQSSKMIVGCIRDYGVSRIADVCLNARE
jgi:hypothetical protein